MLTTRSGIKLQSFLTAWICTKVSLGKGEVSILFDAPENYLLPN